MKNILLMLCVLAGVAFGDCKIQKEVDKMTDEVSYGFTCESKMYQIYFQGDGKKPKFGDRVLLSILSPEYDNLFKDGGQKVKIRIDKNKAFETEIFASMSRYAIYNLGIEDDEVKEQFKKGKKFIMQYTSHTGMPQYIEIDIAGLKKYQ